MAVAPPPRARRPRSAEAETPGQEREQQQSLHPTMHRSSKSTDVADSDTPPTQPSIDGREAAASFNTRRLHLQPRSSCISTSSSLLHLPFSLSHLRPLPLLSSFCSLLLSVLLLTAPSLLLLLPAALQQDGGSLLGPRLAAGSDVLGTGFPFESCVQEQRNSPYYASMYSYRENRPLNTSTVCLQINVLDSCTAGKYRCCNTSINKLKVLPAPNCRGSVSSALINGNSLMSYYWETHEGYDIVKVTPLSTWLANTNKANGAILCLNLRAPCWELKSFAYGGELLEYALYDKKTDNYECCPVGAVNVPASEPGFPSLPPPRRMPPSPPDAPEQPSPPPPPKKKKPPPAMPPATPPPPPSPFPPPPGKKPPPPGKTPPSPLPPPTPPPSPPPPRPSPPPPPSPSPTPPPKKKSPPPPPAPPSTPPLPPPPSPPSPSPPPKKKSPPPPPSPPSTPTLPPPPSPPSPSPPPKKKSPPPPTPAPPPPSPPPPPACGITAAMRRAAAANQGFADSTCSLYGALLLLPLASGAAAPAASYSCVISDPSNMVLTISMAASDAAALLASYGDPAQRSLAWLLLGLEACGSDGVVLSGTCAGAGASVTIDCTSPPPPPPVRRPPPPSPSTRSPPPSPAPSPPPPPPPSPPPPPPRKPPPSPPPPAPPPPSQTQSPYIFVYSTSAYLLFSTPATFTAAEASCMSVGGHLSAIGSEGENAYITHTILASIGPSGSLNTWFGLTIRTDTTAAIPGYNTDGTRFTYIPDDFEYDRTRSAVRYYMLSCTGGNSTCGWRYSPGGASDVQPSYLCEITTAR